MKIVATLICTIALVGSATGTAGASDPIPDLSLHAAPGAPGWQTVATATPTTAATQPEPVASSVAPAAEPVPCTQTVADGSVYCGGGGSPEPQQGEATTAADTITVDNGAGYLVDLSAGELRPYDPEYDPGLTAQFCAVRPEICHNP